MIIPNGQQFDRLTEEGSGGTALFLLGLDSGKMDYVQR